MNHSKSTILPIAGMGLLFFFMALSYFNNSIFLKELFVCSFILGLVFIGKMRENIQD
ncbi:hypothetical protein [Yeosuana marina]|uniref:hypothetical protein n=1 Tax=Yeosuana marina TaxID=1565536 RepID=UPI001423115D|nr:hypothetical protein [Yeosuana marina]